MEVRDLDAEHRVSFLKCLEEWSPDMADVGDRREVWFADRSRKGLRVKLVFDDRGVPGGMIQYLPIEHSQAEGEGLHFILCIWVHGHKQGRGDFQGSGMGTALLKAAEDDARSLGSGGMVAWGLSMPFWMKASWFKRHGYTKVDKDGMMVLLWKPFSDKARPPRWIRPKKRPQARPGAVTVTSFNSGWCSAGNMVHERAKRASSMFGDKVRFEHVDTMDRATLLEWGMSDALFVDGRQVRTGPPPSFDKIKGTIGRRVRKLR
jgi:GNAT superfamily N-acetyltransferase